MGVDQIGDTNNQEVLFVFDIEPYCVSTTLDDLFVDKPIEDRAFTPNLNGEDGNLSI